jgi:nicotinate-nucleotide adenylyltransferase
MHIILFGGAFDPPHLGHSQITRYLLQQQIADQVWYLPVGVHDFLKDMTPVGNRLEMLKIILHEQHSQELDRVKIEDCELHRDGVSHSFDTLEELSQLYPQHQFSFVIGSDNLPDFHRWYSYQQMLEKYKFYVYPRSGFDFKPFYPEMVKLENVQEVAISSTDIRHKVKQGEVINGLVSQKVEKYIKERELYK